MQAVMAQHLPFKYLAYGEITEAQSNRPGSHLAVTLRFGEETFEFRRVAFLGLKKARIFVGIRCANLGFTLTNCELPDEDWAFDPRTSGVIHVDRTVSIRSGRETDSGEEVQATA